MRELIDTARDTVILCVCIAIIIPIMLFGTVEGMIRRWFTNDPGTGC